MHYFVRQRKLRCGRCLEAKYTVAQKIESISRTGQGVELFSYRILMGFWMNCTSLEFSVSPCIFHFKDIVIAPMTYYVSVCVIVRLWNDNGSIVSRRTRYFFFIQFIKIPTEMMLWHSVCTRRHYISSTLKYGGYKLKSDRWNLFDGNFDTYRNCPFVKVVIGKNTQPRIACRTAQNVSYMILAN